MSRIFALTALRAFFFGVIKTEYPSPFGLRTRPIKARKPEGFPFQRIHHPGFPLVQFDTDECELLPDPLQSPFGPDPFRVEAADGRAAAGALGHSRGNAQSPSTHSLHTRVPAREPGRPLMPAAGERRSALAQPLPESITRDDSTLESGPVMTDNKHVVVR
jgi:hypothetical protein